jgi:hypothetical protein
MAGFTDFFLVEIIYLLLFAEQKNEQGFGSTGSAITNPSICALVYAQ